MLRMGYTATQQSSVLVSGATDIEKLSSIEMLSYKMQTATRRHMCKDSRSFSEPSIRDPETIQIIERILAKGNLGPGQNAGLPELTGQDPVVFFAPSDELLELLGSPSGEWASETLFRNKHIFGLRVIYSVRILGRNLATGPAYGLIWNINADMPLATNAWKDQLMQTVERAQQPT